MTNEDKQRIEKEAFIFANSECAPNETQKFHELHMGYVAGATAEHTRAWNEAIEAMKDLIKKDLSIKLGEADRLIEKLNWLKR